MKFNEGACVLDLNFESNVFFNHSHVTDRNATLKLLQLELNQRNEPYFALDAFSATGVRAIRALLETSSNGHLDVTAIDQDKNAINEIFQNCQLNNVSIQPLDSTNTAQNTLSLRVVQSELNAFLHANPKKFHFIDLDPFGAVAQFVEPAILSLKNGGLLCVTSFDFDHLTGNGASSTAACMNKYNAIPLKGVASAEAASRLLIGFVSNVAAKHNKRIEILLTFPMTFAVRFFVKIFDSQDSPISTSVRSVVVCASCGALDQNTDECCVRFQPKEIGPFFMAPLNDDSIVRTLLQDDSLDRAVRAVVHQIECELRDVPFFTSLRRELSALRVSLPRGLDAPMRQLRVLLESRGLRLSSASHTSLLIKDVIKSDASTAQLRTAVSQLAAAALPRASAPAQRLEVARAPCDADCAQQRPIATDIQRARLEWRSESLLTRLLQCRQAAASVLEQRSERTSMSTSQSTTTTTETMEMDSTETRFFSLTHLADCIVQSGVRVIVVDHSPFVWPESLYDIDQSTIVLSINGFDDTLLASLQSRLSFDDRDALPTGASVKRRDVPAVVLSRQVTVSGDAVLLFANVALEAHSWRDTNGSTMRRSDVAVGERQMVCARDSAAVALVQCEIVLPASHVSGVGACMNGQLLLDSCVLLRHATSSVASVSASRKRNRDAMDDNTSESDRRSTSTIPITSQCAVFLSGSSVCIILDSFVSGSSGSNICARQCSTLQMVRTVVAQSMRSALLAMADATLCVDGCRLSEAQWSGIELTDSSRLFAHKCQLEHCHQFGLLTSSATTAELAKVNIIASRSPMELRHFSNVLLRQCILSSNKAKICARVDPESQLKCCLGSTVKIASDTGSNTTNNCLQLRIVNEASRTNEKQAVNVNRIQMCGCSKTK